MYRSTSVLCERNSLRFPENELLQTTTDIIIIIIIIIINENTTHSTGWRRS